MDPSALSKPPLSAASVSKRLIALLTALVMVGQMSTSLYVPSLPSLADTLDADTAEVKLTMTVFLIAFALSQLVYGSVSDRFGRRPVLLAGMMIYVISSVGCALAPTLEALIVGQFFKVSGPAPAPQSPAPWCAIASSAAKPRAHWPLSPWRWP